MCAKGYMQDKRYAQENMLGSSIGEDACVNRTPIQEISEQIQRNAERLEDVINQLGMKAATISRLNFPDQPKEDAAPREIPPVIFALGSGVLRTRMAIERLDSIVSQLEL